MLPTRTVHRLRMRSRDARLIHRGRVLVEDALRTASLPGAGAGLLLVRRLALPPFRAGSSPQGVALALEQRCRGIVPVTVATGAAVDDALIAVAPAVSFADTLQALIALTRALATGHRPAAWCWPLLAPGYAPSLPLPAALACIASGVVRLPERGHGLLLWADTVVAAGAGHALPAALEQIFSAPDTIPVTRGATAPGRPRDAWRRLLTAHATVSSPTARAWLESLAPAIQDLQRESSHAPPATPDDATDRGSAAAATPPASVLCPPPGAGLPAARAVRGAGPAPPGGAAGDARHGPSVAPVPGIVAAWAPPAAPAAPAGDTGAPESPRTPITVPAPASVSSPRDGPHGLPTVAGGLLFLIPVLERCGLPGWLEANPWAAGARLPLRIFARLLERLGAASDDGFRALGDDLEAAPPAPRAVRLPQHWRHDPGRGEPVLIRDRGRLLRMDGTGRLPLTIWQDAFPQTIPAVPAGGHRLPETWTLLADAWVNACRRGLRRRARIGIASLTLRPARVAVTATNVDVWLDPQGVSLAVRRHGLDLDPGWLPWLGRVVCFHYATDDD